VDVVGELADRVRDLRVAALEEPDSPAAAKAHRLKGSALVLGLDELVVAAVALEVALAAGDPSGVARALGAAEAALARLSVEDDLRRLRHDLRNDLGKVLMAVGLLQLELPDDQAERLRIVVEATEAATKRVDLVTSTPSRGSATPEREAPGEAPVEAAPVEGLRVLVVEDDPLVASVVSDVLTAARAVVVVATNLAHGRALLETAVFDSALVDLELGPESGRELLPELTRLGIRSVAFSGDGSDASAGGWDAVVSKSSTHHALVAALR
jgi:CheY-like chemotaxis protein/HPt (histidine-containing phosphotransfer) domain-containing protein